MTQKLVTESRNLKTMNLDNMNISEILEVMNDEDQKVPQIVKKELHTIEKAIQIIVNSFEKNGRLLYVGAGTSGRLGVLDAAECIPTFSTLPDKVQSFIAGGEKALTSSVEGVEDNEIDGVRELKQIHLTPKDVVVGIAASGKTPYVKGALKYAEEVKAKTISISCNKNSEISKFANVNIELETGPEILTGSTRLKAGTAQKLVLNMLSTVSMIRMGKVYKNLMVDLNPTNEKLMKRSIQIIMDAANVDEKTAKYYFDNSDYKVKTAIVMALLRCSKNEADEKLNKSDGFVHKTLTENKNR